MYYIDIHSHLLFGVDDGAKDFGQMTAMLKAAYKDGIRGICVTPHFFPAEFGDGQNTEAAFTLLKDYAAECLPDMQIWLGNELQYHHDCIDNINKGKCHTLNGSKYILVEFDPVEDFHAISHGLYRIQSSGYKPVLAHVERYPCIMKSEKNLSELISREIVIQSNSSAVMGKRGYFLARQLRKMLKKEMIHVISTDAHDMEHRPPLLDECYLFVEEQYGERYARRLFFRNPEKIIMNLNI